MKVSRRKALLERRKLKVRKQLRTSEKPQLTVYRDGADGVMAHTVVAKALVFETQLEAAQAARMYGERWIGQHLRS